MASLKPLYAAAGAGIALLLLAAPLSASSSPTPLALGDSCLVGRWLEVDESAPGNWTWNNEVIAMSGLAGLVLTFRSEGVERIDLNASQPLIGDYHGHQIKAFLRGAVAYHAHATGGKLELSAPAVDVQVTFFYDGVQQPTGSVQYASNATDTYACATTRLRIESLATHSGYGPAVDELDRTASGTGSVSSPPGSVVSTVGSTLATPSALLSAPIGLLVNTLVVLALIFLVTFPSHLFNRTFEANHDAIRAWWERRVPGLRRLRYRFVASEEQDLREAISFGAVVLCGAVLAALLDPGFGPNGRTLALFTGAALALLAGSIVSAAAAGIYRASRGAAGPWHLRALPSGLLVAALCVLISRLTGFQPGYLYGLIGGIVFSRSLSWRQDGHVVAVTSVATLLVALTAWLVWVPVSAQSSSHPTSFAWALASNFLAAMFVSGMVGLLIGLVPLRFLPGEKLVRWHKGVWGAVFGLAALSVIEVMLRPQSAGAHAASVPFWTTAGLFVGFGAASTLFWSYFRLRRTDGRPHGARALTLRRK